MIQSLFFFSLGWVRRLILIFKRVIRCFFFFNFKLILFLWLSDSYTEKIALKSGMSFKRWSNKFISANLLGVRAFKYEEKVNDLLSEYKGAFMFLLVVITLCGFTHLCVFAVRAVIGLEPRRKKKKSFQLWPYWNDA